jgi:hypothetical protein
MLCTKFCAMNYVQFQLHVNEGLLQLTRSAPKTKLPRTCWRADTQYHTSSKFVD